MTAIPCGDQRFAILEPGAGAAMTAFGSMRSFVVAGSGPWVCLALAGESSLHCAGVSPRQASHFGVRITSLREVSGPRLRLLLQGQKKVTKEEALKTKRSSVPPSLQHRGTAVDTSLASLIPRTVGQRIGANTALASECVQRGHEWAQGARRREKAPPRFRMPERGFCHSGGRRFGVLRMPGPCPQRASVLE